MNEAREIGDTPKVEQEPPRSWYQQPVNWLWGYDFFISYHWTSGGTYAVNLAAKLREKGYDVFLDRAEYAMGDKWKHIGEVALRNTRRLVLIATRGAVFDSKPVAHEIVKFTDRGRHCIPIFFGDTFATERQAQIGQFIVLDRLPADTLFIADELENLPLGPRSEIVDKLIAAHGIMRKRLLRQIIILIALSLLTALTVLALIARYKEADARDVAEERFAAVSMQNGERAISSDEDIGAAVLWYAQALQSTGNRSEPARISARSLIGAWTRSLPKASIVHDLDVGGMWFSPDCAMIATARGGIVRIWDAQTGEPRSEPLKHDYPVHLAAFSPDGGTLATSSSFGNSGKQLYEVWLWDVRTGQRGEPIKHSASVRILAFSPDSRILATEDQMTARLWDSKTGESIGELSHKYWISSLQFGSNGMLCTGSGDRENIPGKASTWAVGETRIWDVHEKKLLFRPLSHEEPVHVLLSPDEQTLATLNSGKVRLWDVRTGNPLGERLDVEGSVNAVAFSPDSRTLATGSARKKWGEVCLWDAGTGKQLFSKTVFSGPVLLIAFDRKGEKLTTAIGSPKYGEEAAEEAAEVAVWDIKNLEPLGLPIKVAGNVKKISLDANGHTFAIVNPYNIVQLWDTRCDLPRRQLPKQDGDIVAMAFNPNGRMLVAAGGGNTARLYDSFSGELQEPILPHDEPVNAVSFSPDGSTLATASQDKTVRLWNVLALAERPRILQHLDVVNAVLFSSDGRMLATGSGNFKSNEPVNELRLYNAARTEAPPVSLKLDYPVKELSLRSDGRAAATVGLSYLNGTLRSNVPGLWETQTRKSLLASIQQKDDIGTESVALSPDCRILAVSTTSGGDNWENYVYQTDLRDARTGNRLCKTLTHDDSVDSLSFSPDSRVLLTKFNDSLPQLWDMRTGNSRGNPIGCLRFCGATVFSKDSRQLAVTSTGEYENETRLWDVHTGHPCGAPIKHDRQVRVIALSPDGRTLATADYDHRIRLWDVPPPVDGNFEIVSLSAEVRTGRKIDAGRVLSLTQAEWLERVRKLSYLVGPVSQSAAR